MHSGSRKGQAIILVVVAASLLLIGVLGFALDGGQMYAQRQMAQAAADAAAQAGIMSIMRGTNATSTFTFGTGTPPLAAYTCTTTDGRTPCVYARNNGFGGTSSDTVTLSYPSSVTGVTLSSASVPAIQVTVQRTLNTGFVQFLKGPATTTITAKAIAGIVGSVSPDSIFVLSPTANDAFQVSGSASLNVGGGAIAIDSSNSKAASVSGAATVSAAAIHIVGGISVTGSASTSPAAVTGAAPVADPFASLPAPTVGSCLYTNLSLGGVSSTALGPGTYCGGISIGGSATATFSAGNYIINGGGVSFSGASSVSGSGVMFYLTGTNATYASVAISGSASATFSAPTSGTYMGVLFFQNRSITSSSNASFSGAVTPALTGSLYFPTTSVIYSGSASSSTYMAIVANEVSFSGATTLKYDSTGAKTGLFTGGVALIQ